MKLIIFGATGGTGRHLVEQALQQGHEVSAFVRDAAKLNISHPNLRAIEGNVLDQPSVERALPGHDAVVCAIGTPANKTGTLRSQGTHNIVRGMQNTGLKRLVCQASLGYGDSKPLLGLTPFVFRNIIVPFVLKKGFADHALQEDHIKRSGLDWVIVRPGNLTDGAHTGEYQHGFPATAKNLRMKVSRADVADFMLKQVDNVVYLHKTPGISY